MKTTIMEESDKLRYIQCQVNFEIEYIRSWPTKVMAFYVAINFGIISAVIALQKFNPPAQLHWGMKVVLTIIVVILASWMLRILCKSNNNYIDNRNLQIDLQKKLFNEAERKEYKLPKSWFKKREGRNCRKYPGWLFYVFVLIIVAGLVVTGIFNIG